MTNITMGITLLTRLFWMSPKENFEAGQLFYRTLRITHELLMFAGMILNIWTLSIILKLSARARKKLLLIISVTFVDLLACLSILCFFYFFYSAKLNSLFNHSYFFYVFMCRFVTTRYIADSFTGVSSWHLVMISIERYISLQHKDWYMQHFTKYHHLLFVSISWVIGSVSMARDFWITKYTAAGCEFSALVDGNKEPLQIAMAVFEFFAILLVPIAIMIFIYVKVYRVYIRNERLMLSASAAAFDVPASDNAHSKSRYIFRTILLSVLIYAISWAPKELMRLLCVLQILKVNDFVLKVYILSQALTPLNSLCNPILYACSYGQFRYEFLRQLNLIGLTTKAIFCCDRKTLAQIWRARSTEDKRQIVHEDLVRKISVTSSVQIDYGTMINSYSIMNSHRTWSSNKS